MARRESAGQCLAPPGPWCQPQPAHDAPEHALALHPLGSGGMPGGGGQEAMCHYSYRMSKAALNMGSRILAGEWAGRFPGASVITVRYI